MLLFQLSYCNTSASTQSTVVMIGVLCANDAGAWETVNINNLEWHPADTDAWCGCVEWECYLKGGGSRPVSSRDRPQRRRWQDLHIRWQTRQRTIGLVVIYAKQQHTSVNKENYCETIPLTNVICFHCGLHTNQFYAAKLWNSKNVNSSVCVSCMCMSLCMCPIHEPPPWQC